MTNMLRLAAIYLCASSGIVMSTMAALPQGQQGIFGTWASADDPGEDWCNADFEGKTRREQLASHLLTIDKDGMEWEFQAESCKFAKLDGGPFRYTAKADCNSKNVDITFTLSGSDRITIGFSDTSGTDTYKRCG
jgi:hypothetical protein